MIPVDYDKLYLQQPLKKGIKIYKLKTLQINQNGILKIVQVTKRKAG